MILYFSATKNSKFIAMKLSKSLNTKALNIEDLIKDNKYKFDLKDEEYLGVITPTYFYGLPLIVKNYLSKLELINTANVYSFALATFGGESGMVHKMIAKSLKRNNIKLNSKIGCKMVDTYTIMFDVSNKELVKKQEANVLVQLDAITNLLKNKENRNYNKKSVPAIFSSFAYILYLKGRSTKKFKSNGKCVSCKLCELQCPAKAIVIENNIPVWKKNKCERCLRCIHKCPYQAIEYGNKTLKHGQYVNEME